MKKLPFAFIAVLVLGLFFRLALIPVAKHGDINNNTSWGKLLIERGAHNFYEGDNWTYSAPNQPPLYLYLFGATTLIHQGVSSAISSLNANLSIFPSPIVWWWETWGELVMAKLPGILADLGIAGLIYWYLKKNQKTALFLSLIWIVNPVSWYNSAIWGGTDGLVNLIGLFSVLCLLRKRLEWSALLFVASMLFKGSLALFIPLYLFIALRQSYPAKRWMYAVIVSLVFTICVVLPFHFQFDVVLWLIRLYVERFFPGEIGSLTANAFNFWWLVDSGKTLDSTLYWGLSARIWGIILTTICYLFVVWKARKSKTSDLLLLSFSLIGLFTFLFMTRIHERYLYPFFPFATLVLRSLKTLWLPYVVLSITYTLNLYHLFWAPEFIDIRTLYTSPLFMIALSLLNIGMFLTIIWRTRKSL